MLKESNHPFFTDRTRTPATFLQESPRVRTRGPIRNLDSGGLAAMAVLSELIKEIRRQVANLPIIIMVHGQDASSKIFLERLSSTLKPDDTLWLISEEESQISVEFPIFEGTVSLDLRQEQDARLYNNLFFDLAFFSASDEEQVSLGAQLSNRSRALIINRPGKFSDALLAAIAESGDTEPCITTICFWEGADRLEAVDPMGRAMSGYMLQSMDSDIIGKELKERTILWESQLDRRINFRSFIQSLRSSGFMSQSFLEDLFRKADVDDWPAWAVQSIGPLYLPLDPAPDKRARALAWRRLLDCVADRSQVVIIKELCGGQVQEAFLPPAASELIYEIDKRFQESISSKGVASDRAFLGLFAHILHEVELSVAGPEMTQRIKEVRESILQESGVMRESEAS